MERSFDNEYIYDLYNRPSRSIRSEDFYGSSRSELQSMTDQSSSFLKWDIELIPKIQKFNHTHYLCPKCFRFPLIDIISKEIILYKCKCDDEKRKALNIKQLFNKDNGYMTFFEGNDLLSFPLDSKDKIKGFKCIENHGSKKK